MLRTAEEGFSRAAKWLHFAGQLQLPVWSYFHLLMIQSKTLQLPTLISPLFSIYRQSSLVTGVAVRSILLWHAAWWGCEGA